MAMAASGGNELLDLFTRYNNDLWPIHVLTYAMGVAAVALLFVDRRDRADRLTAGLLAALWLWLGVVFQGLYATDIDQTLGLVYAVLFVLEAFLIVRHGVLNRELVFVRRNGLAGWVGWVALGYAVVVYPLVGALLGHGWPGSPLLGMAPCPTTIATFGLFLLAMPPFPKRLLIVPVVWAILAPPAAMSRGVYEDLGLLLVGVGASVLVLVRDRRTHSKPHHPAIDEYQDSDMPEQPGLPRTSSLDSSASSASAPELHHRMGGHRVHP